MIIYKGIFAKLKAAGYTTTRLKKEKLIPESTLSRIRAGEMVNLSTIDTICRLTKLPIFEIIEYVEDDQN